MNRIGGQRSQIDQERICNAGHGRCLVCRFGHHRSGPSCQQTISNQVHGHRSGNTMHQWFGVANHGDGGRGADASKLLHYWLLTMVCGICAPVVLDEIVATSSRGACTVLGDNRGPSIAPAINRTAPMSNMPMIAGCSPTSCCTAGKSKT